MTTTNRPTIRAKAIPGTNSYQAVGNYQGQPLACKHRHASAHRARQCADLLAQAMRLAREARAQA